ncbi:MAG: Ldh family oxidoreductase [Pigmentiphaga sp.]
MNAPSDPRDPGHTGSDPVFTTPRADPVTSIIPATQAAPATPAASANPAGRVAPTTPVVPPSPSTLAAAARTLGQALAEGEPGRLAARAVLEAELLQMPRFGLDLLAESHGAADVSALLADNAPAVSRHDCQTLDSPVAVAAATLALIPRARHHGVAATFLTGIAGFGRFAPFMRHLADAGLAGMAGTEGGPLVAPAGGRRGVLSTNPLAFAVGQGADRVVIDVATSAITLAAAKAARQQGSPLPEGAALDADGQPTRDAALMAALLPRGGMVGSLLGLIVELLAGVIGGGRSASGERGATARRGVFLLAFDPAQAGDTDWPAGLAQLRNDWQDAGGHWPSGRPLADDAPLPLNVIDRLDATLSRLAATPAC